MTDREIEEKKKQAWEKHLEGAEYKSRGAELADAYVFSCGYDAATASMQEDKKSIYQFAHENREMILKEFPFPEEHQTATEVMLREAKIMSYLRGYLSMQEEMERMKEVLEYIHENGAHATKMELWEAVDNWKRSEM